VQRPGEQGATLQRRAYPNLLGSPTHRPAESAGGIGHLGRRLDLGDEGFRSGNGAPASAVATRCRGCECAGMDVTGTCAVEDV
jgi:hypothetical protein